MLDEAVKEKEVLEIEVAELNIQIASIKEEFEEQANQVHQSVMLSKQLYILTIGFFLCSLLC